MTLYCVWYREELREELCRGWWGKRYRFRENKMVQSINAMLRNLGSWTSITEWWARKVLKSLLGHTCAWESTQSPESQHSPPWGFAIWGGCPLYHWLWSIPAYDCGPQQFMTWKANGQEATLDTDIFRCECGGHVCCKAKMASKYRILSNPR